MEVSEAAMDIEDQGTWFDDATTFEPVYLANLPAPIQVEDQTWPMEGKSLVDVIVKETHNEWQK